MPLFSCGRGLSPTKLRSTYKHSVIGICSKHRLNVSPAHKRHTVADSRRRQLACSDELIHILARTAHQQSRLRERQILRTLDIHQRRGSPQEVALAHLPLLLRLRRTLLAAISLRTAIRHKLRAAKCTNFHSFHHHNIISFNKIFRAFPPRPDAMPAPH